MSKEIQIDEMEIREHKNSRGEKFIGLSHKSGEGITLNERELKELGVLLKEFLSKIF